ncbi:MAG TPA: efflux RND transporter periplasmic adaptor subunit [Acidobacteriota bacterium]|nr:MAG: Multidrug resistance protein MexA precursor [Planctomycetes bacterium ADurb.Bin126]HOD84650.1 efflux RND transporter periplasmic adaptor subunit [Phycisphaerae bacterium]HQM64985.1 efflux RND transporter periplasmic adaptor subunit [Acidobacteriota bacterium]
MTDTKWVRIVLAAVAAAVCVPGCDRGKQAPPPPPPEVATLIMQAQPIPLTVELPGRISAFLVAEIRPQVSGLIQKRLFTEGVDVKEGDVLYEIDPSSYQAACDSAEAAVALAKASHVNSLAAVTAAKAGHATAVASRDAAKAALAATHAAQARAEANAVPLRLRTQRFKDLLADKAVSQQDYDDASAALKQAEAGIQSAAAAVQGAEADVVRAQAAIEVALADIQKAESAVQSAQAGIGSAEAGLRTAKINLGYTQVKAPIDGRIGRSAITTGALVTAHQPVPLATIQQLNRVYVDVPRATTDLLRLQRRLADGRLSQDASRNSVKLILEDNSVYPLHGTLQFRDVTVDPSTGSFILRMVFPNPDNVLLPGMFVRAVVTEGVNENAILVPQQAVSRDPKGNPLALIVDQSGVAQVRMLTLDRTVTDRWLVSKGLSVGDRVIVEGLQRVRPGMPVRAVPLAAAKPDSASTKPASGPATKAD